ncbi:MAG: hypothetical protein IJ646_08325 [Clostridia bacterium]|nr:hypothetical protein [Clostridia bacterium]
MTAKTMDNHNRWRSKTVAFRMSPEEANQLQREVVVRGNPRVYKGLRIQMEAVHEELQRISEKFFFDDELLDRVEQIITIMNHMKAESDDP